MKKKIPLYIFDLDGTIADISHRLHYITGDKKDWDTFNRDCIYDKPIVSIIDLMRALDYNDNSIEIWTGRSESVRDQTMEWLKYYSVLYSGLKMRPEGDYRPDVELKGGWLDYLLTMRSRPEIIFEDRTKMVDFYRSRGMICAQVAESNY